MVKDGEAAPRRQHHIESADFRVHDLVNSVLHDPRVLVEQVLEAGLLAVEVGEVDGGVLELAAVAVEAGALHVGDAVRHAPLAGHVCLLLQLVLTMGESAALAIFALTGSHVELAQLRLRLLLEVHLGLRDLRRRARHERWHELGGRDRG